MIAGATSNEPSTAHTAETSAQREVNKTPISSKSGPPAKTKRKRGRPKKATIGNETPSSIAKKQIAPSKELTHKQILTCNFCLKHKERYPSVMARHQLSCRARKQSDCVDKPSNVSSNSEVQRRQLVPLKKRTPLTCKLCSRYTTIWPVAMSRHRIVCQRPIRLLTCKFCQTHTERYPSRMAIHEKRCQPEKPCQRGRPRKVDAKLLLSPKNVGTESSCPKTVRKRLLVCRYCKSHTETGPWAMSRHHKVCPVKRVSSKSRSGVGVYSTCEYCGYYGRKSNMARHHKRPTCKESRHLKSVRGKRECRTTMATYHEKSLASTDKQDLLRESYDITPALTGRSLRVQLPSLSVGVLSSVQQAAQAAQINKENGSKVDVRNINTGIPQQATESHHANDQCITALASAHDSLGLSNAELDCDMEDVDFTCPYKDFEMHQCDRETVHRHLDLHCWYCAFCAVWIKGFNNYSQHFSMCKVRPYCEPYICEEIIMAQVCLWLM